MTCPSLLSVGILLSMLTCSPAAGQVAGVPRAWLGVWKMNLQRSTFDERAPVVVQEQALTIEATSEALILTAETTLRDGRRVSEAANLAPNGEATIGPGGVATVFKATDSSSFDVIVSLTSPAAGELMGLNRFVFSADGRSLVETKTQTRRESLAGGQGLPPAADTVRFVLVFERQE